jgi:hypothetical protein
LPMIYACEVDFAPVLGCPIIRNRSKLSSSKAVSV